MKPPCCCSGVTGTSPATTVTPVENKTLKWNRKKGTHSAWKEDVCWLQTHIGLVLWIGEEDLHRGDQLFLLLFMFCTFQLQSSDPWCHLQRKFSGICAGNNSSGMTSFLKRGWVGLAWGAVDAVTTIWSHFSHLDLRCSLKRNDPVAAFGGSRTRSWSLWPAIVSHRRETFTSDFSRMASLPDATGWP